jgi:hypothetical protein
MNHRLQKLAHRLQSLLLCFPRVVHCNVCGWRGRRFLGDGWHRNVKCPRCRLGVRQRLFFAALKFSDRFSTEHLLAGRRILHFAPEAYVRSAIPRSASYVTADLLQTDCDLRLDMCAMTEVPDGSYDLLLAFDVLEHVADLHAALDEAHRVLAPGASAVFTVPQQDGLALTCEDPAATSPEDRKRLFGQPDHLRIFGNDFPAIVEAAGFEVSSVDESCFTPEQQRLHVLRPPSPSTRPLATNHRKVFFCTKRATAA